jgi:regulator of ribonuclease activity A
MTWATADLCDAYRGVIQVAEPVLKPYGGLRQVTAPVETIWLDEDNRALREMLMRPGEGRALFVDVGGAYCAVLGDIMGAMAVDNGWRALFINGYVRDSAQLAEMPIGVWALGTCPMKSLRSADGEVSVPLVCLGLEVSPGSTVYADEDGVLITPSPLI